MGKAVLESTQTMSNNRFQLMFSQFLMDFFSAQLFLQISTKLSFHIHIFGKVNLFLSCLQNSLTLNTCKNKSNLDTQQCPNCCVEAFRLSARTMYKLFGVRAAVSLQTAMTSKQSESERLITKARGDLAIVQGKARSLITSLDALDTSLKAAQVSVIAGARLSQMPIPGPPSEPHPEDVAKASAAAAPVVTAAKTGSVPQQMTPITPSPFPAPAEAHSKAGILQPPPVASPPTPRSSASSGIGGVSKAAQHAASKISKPGLPIPPGGRPPAHVLAQHAKLTSVVADDAWEDPNLALPKANPKMPTGNDDYDEDTEEDVEVPRKLPRGTIGNDLYDHYKATGTPMRTLKDENGRITR